MGRTRKPYRHMKPTIESIIKYVDVCDRWLGVDAIGLDIKVKPDSAQKMCERMVNHGLMNRREVLMNGAIRYEYYPTDKAREIYERELDDT